VSHPDVEREWVVRFLDDLRAAEGAAAEVLGAWIAVCRLDGLRGALRAIAEREAAHAELLADRLREIGAPCDASLDERVRAGALARFGSRTVPDEEKLALVVARSNAASRSSNARPPVFCSRTRRPAIKDVIPIAPNCFASLSTSSACIASAAALKSNSLKEPSVCTSRTLNAELSSHPIIVSPSIDAERNAEITAPFGLQRSLAPSFLFTLTGFHRFPRSKR